MLSALVAARRFNREWDAAYESEFKRLLSATDATAREARVAAMSYYLGEAHGTLIVCRVAADGKRVKSLLEKYNRCSLMQDRELLPSLHPSGLRERARTIIEEGSWSKTCRFR